MGDKDFLLPNPFEYRSPFKVSDPLSYKTSGKFKGTDPKLYINNVHGTPDMKVFCLTAGEGLRDKILVHQGESAAADERLDLIDRLYTGITDACKATPASQIKEEEHLKPILKSGMTGKNSLPLPREEYPYESSRAQPSETEVDYNDPSKVSNNPPNSYGGDVHGDARHNVYDVHTLARTVGFRGGLQAQIGKIQ
ncbi:hypothetical protein ABW19_dt0207581 [Dactylella cylindrospora]|nr:hypothetical protein ABW19_dt0207581 [Dactylella cylindrospora]